VSPSPTGGWEDGPEEEREALAAWEAGEEWKRDTIYAPAYGPGCLPCGCDPLTVEAIGHEIGCVGWPERDAGPEYWSLKRWAEEEGR
jgi:hypothetical protein